MTYLDEAATTPVRREVLEAMWPYLTGLFGNAASHHEAGEAAAAAVESARRDIAERLNARPTEITFTSGGTEADNAAIKGIAWAAPRGRHLIVSSVEHPAVLEAARWFATQGFHVDELPVDQNGLVHVGDLADLLTPDTTAVSVQYANNEVGTVQPVAELAAVAAQHGVPFHTDAVQAGPWLSLDVQQLGVQAMSLSGHKFGAPKGVGVLYASRRLAIEPLIHGGGQQDSKRSGTENVAGAVAMAVGLALAQAEDASAVAGRRDRFIDAVLTAVPGAELTGHRTARLPGHASFVFPGRSGESILLDLQQRGVMSSSGSACAAGSDEPSHVLTAMGYSREVAQSSVRFTFGASTTDAELGKAVDILKSVAS